METYTSVSKTDEAKLKEVLTAVQAAPSCSTQAKERFVEELFNDLEPKSTTWASWSNETRHEALLTLKILSRVPGDNTLIRIPRGVTLLMMHGGLLASGPGEDQVEEDPQTSREALKCLSNCLLQHEECLAEFEKNEGVVLLLQMLKKAHNAMYSTDDVFLYVRLLFICTATNSETVHNVVDKYDGVDILNKCMVDNVERLLRIPTPTPSENLVNGGDFTTSMVVSELFKVVFNLQHHYGPSVANGRTSEAHAKFEGFLNSAISVLMRYPTPQPLPLVPPVSSALHMLLNFPVGAYSEIWFPNGDLGLVHLLVGMLKDSLECLIPIGNEAGLQAENPDVHGKEDTDNVLPPLAIVLTKIAAEHKEARGVLKRECLPGESERALPVDKGRSLSARLIRLLTCIRFPKLKETVGTLLFSICEENASEFVKEVGFGNGAGFLVMNNIPFPHPASLSSSSSERPYDVVTGEYIDVAKRANAELAAMTDEEKEREAEKLFVLFERLNKTGVITAENPVGKAIREGKV